MKKLFVIIAIGTMAACNNSTDSGKTTTDSTTMTTDTTNKMTTDTGNKMMTDTSKKATDTMPKKQLLYKQYHFMQEISPGISGNVHLCL